jgi:hypothetical protein
MIQNDIAERIINGEKIRILITGYDSKELENLYHWVRQFRRSNSGGNCINCNMITDIRGNETLDLDIGIIPHGQRELLVGTLVEKASSEKSPLTIKEKEKAQ